MSKNHKHEMSGTAAVQSLLDAGVAHRLHQYQHDPAVHGYGREAAEQLGIAPDRLFKSLIVQLTGGDTALVTAVVPVDAQLDLKALAGVLGVKRAALADPGLAQRTTGYLVGGISPLGQQRPTPVIVDASAEHLDTMLVSAGRRGLQMELAPADLIRLSRGRFARIAR